MHRPIVRPLLDPLAHKSAIDALEAQRAAYRRYARNVESQRQQLGDGDADRAVAFAETATRDFDELDAGARRVQPLVQRVHEVGSADQVSEVRRHMEALMHDARSAETAIRNLATQLEAWRDAYGRQLAELGVTPGAEGQSGAVAGTEGEDGRASRLAYGQPGFGRASVKRLPRILDRKG